MQQVYRLLEKIVASESTVLIHGESGTGKELVARAIHYNGPRAKRPFVVQNCSAFNDNLLESALFGHSKGAFTGAVKDKKGLFEMADGGTFFLDEVGDMSPALQVKLLRVLQEGTFTPVGATEVRQVDVRVIAATHKDLQKMVEHNEFREDLYYRINVIKIQIPPLRDRMDDMAILIDHFLRKHYRPRPAHRARARRAWGRRGRGRRRWPPCSASLAGQHPRAGERDRAPHGAGRRSRRAARGSLVAARARSGGPGRPCGAGAQRAI